MIPTWLDETRRQNSTKFLVWEFFQFFEEKLGHTKFRIYICIKLLIVK
jgi:hypothetical protein